MRTDNVNSGIQTRSFWQDSLLITSRITTIQPLLN